MNVLKQTISCIIISFFGITMSNAQSGERREHKPPTVDEIFEKMDANEDDQLSEEEIKGPLKRDFAKIDVNEDGFISREELENAPKPERRGRQRN